MSAHVSAPVIFLGIFSSSFFICLSADFGNFPGCINIDAGTSGDLHNVLFSNRIESNVFFIGDKPVSF